ncbi:hypothetical protein AXK61_21660 [Tsukamurella pseudospumae]|uniref:Uncharacterized protein n=1 Tax=Tsukamurella pseudospumae TaxID=239498 RepID=A0A137ZI08_9ACTN|nr:hypothetical protein AXK61_21660 [Tsukamurella pseudospumae]
MKLDGAVPPGAERIAMDCRVAAGSVVASPADPLNAPEYAPMVSLRTGGAPTTETVMFSVRVGVLLGDKPFTTAVDGGSYVISGTASGLAGSVDQGGITQVKKSFEVRLTCPA